MRGDDQVRAYLFIMLYYFDFFIYLIYSKLHLGLYIFIIFNIHADFHVNHRSILFTV